MSIEEYKKNKNSKQEGENISSKEEIEYDMII